MPGVQLRAVSPADGRVVGANEEGELQAKAPQLMRGYLDEALNADGYADGWFRTGDLGVIDEQGYVRITGRLKDVIIRKGENVSAKEVEDLLYEHERVRDVAVVGVPDSERGEMVVAVLALEKEAAPLSMEEMQEFLRGKGLRNQALPERLEHVDELPRNASGKIVKNELRDRYSD
jgi:acyl-CoA synthetase (AMP-forming)/AMP-acid ligase II